MNVRANPNASAAAQLPNELAALRRELEQARAELAAVSADVAAAEGPFGGAKAAQIVQANEQLVLAAVRAQTEVDTVAEEAAAALKEALRSTNLDALTGLPNRVLLRDRLAQAISGAKRHDTRSALLFLDLNNFKQINDTLGHTVGDQVLKLAAGRLASSVRAADTVSRHGGDEFLILLTEVAQVGDAVAIADKLDATLAVPSRVGDRDVHLTASIGISLYPDDGEDADTLIERADAAMYHAKRHGLRKFVFQNQPASIEPNWASADLPSPRHAQLQEANERLVLAALTAQELQAVAEHTQARQMEVLAVVAHELRNPLGAIRSAAALLGRGRADEQLLQRVQDVIERQVAHVARLAGDLLDLSRARTSRFRLERQTVDMAELIDQAVQSCRPALYARLQQLEICVPSCTLHVDGDPVRLTQVFGNLLDNASKYTPVGGAIDLCVTADEGAIVMTLSDNGIGITAEALPDIFEPFVQDKHAVAFNGTGLGIGLTVVRELVEAHGGSVVARSAGTGFGSQFVVTLPLIGA
jgi:diguanylate cyclase